MVVWLAKGWGRRRRQEFTYERLLRMSDCHQWMRCLGAFGGGGRMRRTWDDISCIHRVIIFDEAKAIHELHLGDITSPIFEMG